MADKKISALTAATTPLAGTEVLPIVQSGSTVKVAVSNLTAGRAVSADSLALTGSPLPVTSGGTGLASYTQYGVFYANTTTSVSTAGKLTFDGKDFGVGNSRVSFGANISGITLDNTGANQHITWRVNSVTQASAYTNGTSGFIFGTESNTPLQFQIGGVVKAELQTDGDLSVGNGNFVPATAAKGINFTANTPAAGMTSQLLNWYEEITAASTACTGAITTAASWTLTRVGNVVTLTLPPVTGAATSSVNFEFGVLIPSGYRPSSSLLFPCGVRDNDANQTTAGMVIITSAGNIRVYVNIAASANFTANASATAAGFAQGCGFSCSWRL